MVFRALRLVQVETNEVCIPDFDYDTISWMLRYMYGCLELTPQHLSHARVMQPSVAFTCCTAEPSGYDVAYTCCTAFSCCNVVTSSLC